MSSLSQPINLKNRIVDFVETYNTGVGVQVKKQIIMKDIDLSKELQEFYDKNKHLELLRNWEETLKKSNYYIASLKKPTNSTPLPR